MGNAYGFNSPNIPLTNPRPSSTSTDLAHSFGYPDAAAAALNNTRSFLETLVDEGEGEPPVSEWDALVC